MRAARVRIRGSVRSLPWPIADRPTRRGRFPRARRALRWCWPGAVLALLLVTFFWKPLTSDGYYAPTDILQGSALLQVDTTPHTPHNAVQADPVDQMHPWLHFNREHLRDGRLPLWNPFNGWGSPHLAALQTAVYSPFSAPFYVVGFRLALLVSAAAKLALLAGFTYLFLRRVARSRWASLVGATAFTFAGYQVLWLNWAHVGSVVHLPAGLYFAEGALRAQSAGHRFRQLTGLTVSLAVGLLAGHPETFAFGALPLLVYVAARVAGTPAGARWRRAAELAGALAVSLLLCAAQLLPFWEYARVSASYAERQSHTVPGLRPMVLGLQAFPELLGNPTHDYHDPALAQLDNFNEANGAYVGLTVLLLAGIGTVVALRRREVRFVPFIVTAALWLVFAFDTLGLLRLLQHGPARSVVPGRGPDLWTFSLAALAALGTDAILRLAGRGLARRAAALAAGAVATAALAGVSAVVVVQWAERQPGSQASTGLAASARNHHIAALLACFALAATVAVWAVATRRPSARAVVGPVLVAAVFTQTGWLWRDLNPTIDRRFFYPETARLAAVTRVTGDDQTLRLDAGTLPADSNLWYRLRSPMTYDALGNRHYQALFTRLLRTAPFLDDARPVSLRALQVLGIRYVTTTRPYPTSEPAAAASLSDATGATPRPITAGAPVGQDFTASAPGLAGLLLPVAPVTGACSIVVTVEDVEARAVVARHRSTCATDSVLATFEPRRDSAGRRYRLRVESDVVGTGAPAVYVNRAGHLVAQPFAAEVAGLERVWTDGVMTLFRVPDAVPAFSTVATTEVVPSDGDAIDRLLAPGFDPRRAVLVDQAPPRRPPGTDGSGTVRVVSRDTTRVRLAVDRDGPGWLLALQTWSPGWTATVDGRAVPLQRANVAFTAVPVPGGSSEVVLRYRPTSVRVGLWISGLTLLALVILAIAASAAARASNTAGRADRGPEPLPSAARRGSHRR